MLSVPSSLTTPPSLIVPAPLPVGHLAAAATVLARAFHDDPVTAYITPEPEQRLPVMSTFMIPILRSGLEHGHVFALQDPPRAVTIWHTIDNDRAEMPEPDLSSVLSVIDEPGQERLLTVLGEMAELHARLMPQPHVYLAFLAVDPEHQGQGLGSTLLAPILDYSRSHGLPCYLETMNPINLPFYTRHGFRVVHDSRLTNSTVTMWTMCYN